MGWALVRTMFPMFRSFGSASTSPDRHVLLNSKAEALENACESLDLPPGALARLGENVGSVRDGGVRLSERAGGCGADYPSVVAAVAVFLSRSCPVGVETGQCEYMPGCRSQLRESSAAYS